MRGLFRGKRVDNDEWVIGNLRYNLNAPQILSTANGVAYDVVPSTVGEAVPGLFDKNGVNVFEGDVLRPFDNEIIIVSWIDHYHTLGLTVYLTQTFKKRGKEVTKTYEGKALFLDYDFNRYEVIGNIHDNPGILDQISITQ